jgi:hypothetical protein
MTPERLLPVLSGFTGRAGGRRTHRRGSSLLEQRLCSDAVVLAEVDEGNEASVRVIERLGMTRFAVVPGLLGPMVRYRGSP